MNLCPKPSVKMALTAILAVLSAATLALADFGAQKTAVAERFAAALRTDGAVLAVYEIPSPEILESASLGEPPPVKTLKENYEFVDTWNYFPFARLETLKGDAPGLLLWRSHAIISGRYDYVTRCDPPSEYGSIWIMALEHLPDRDTPGPSAATLKAFDAGQPVGNVVLRNCRDALARVKNGHPGYSPSSGFVQLDEDELQDLRALAAGDQPRTPWGHLVAEYATADE